MTESATLQKMVQNADVLVTARCDGVLVVSPAPSPILPFAPIYPISPSMKNSSVTGHRPGIRLRRTHEAAGLHTQLILLAAESGKATIRTSALSKHESCWTISRQPCT